MEDPDLLFPDKLRFKNDKTFLRNRTMHSGINKRTLAV